MTIKQWPEAERPREKLVLQGASQLSDAELLAIFLRVGTPGKTAVDLAREIIQEFGSLRRLIDSNIQQFCQTKGLGLAKYTQLQASLEIGRRYLHETLQKQPILANSAATCNYLTSKLRRRQSEIFAILFLNSKQQLICYEEVFRGTIDNAHIHPREVIKRVLHHNAKAVIFAHNHPSGIAEPSDADRFITERLRESLALIDVDVLDHIIIGEGKLFSFAGQGWV